MKCALPTLVAAVIGVAAGCGGSDKSGNRDNSDAPPEHAFALIGSWHGRLTQKKLQPFDVTARIRSLSSGRRNTVAYTGIDCSGTWTYLGRTNGVFRFREVIDRGQRPTCKDVGTVSLTPQGADQLRYEFRGGGIDSRGVLSRGG